MNLLNVAKKGYQSSVLIRKKSVQMNLLNVEKKRLANNHTHQKKKRANESAECREKRLFLKRNPKELRVNNYNYSACLSAWGANMDIQSVLDVYACDMYVVSYISKAQKGISQLL